MQHGQLEPSDADVLDGIYKKINADGMLKEPLTVQEQVLLFSLAKWIGANTESKPVEYHKVHIPHYGDVLEAFCPHCDTMLPPTLEEMKPDYCPWCGKGLEW